jgi:uracil-DNA glycosylase family 4
MAARRAAYLGALGVTDWRQRRPLAAAAVASQVLVAPAAATAGSDTWDQVSGEVATCTRCELHACRNRTVFGVGDRNARWLIVGEAPGAEEDLQGEPFVGRAGKLLDSMLLAIGLRRDQVFIANVLKCRPTGNRNPAPQEVAQCLPYLERQIALLQPSIMLALGSIAAQNLLATDVPVGRLRGQVHAFGSARTPLVVTYHPAYLLRSPGEKRKSWEDLKFARRVAGGLTA